MLKIRLQRVGKKHDPSFRIVLTDSRKGPKSGAFLEILGNYNAQKGNPQFKDERIKHWISKGAKISDTVNNLLVNAKIIERKKIDVLHHDKIKKSKEKKESEPKEEKTSEPKEEKSENKAKEEKIEEKTESVKEETKEIKQEEKEEVDKK